MSLVYGIAICLVGGNFTQYFDHKALSYRQSGFLLMIPFLMIGMSELFFSHIAELIGRRKAILIGILFTASAFIGISQFTAMPRLILCMFSLGIGMSLLYDAFRAWTNAALDDLYGGNRPVGIHENSYIRYAALLLGSLGGVYLLAHDGAYTFMVSGILMLLGFAPVLFIPENYGRARYTQLSGHLKMLVNEIFSNLVFKYFAATCFLTYIAKGIFFFAWQRHLIQVGHLEMHLAIFYFIMILSGDLGRYVFKHFLSEMAVDSRGISFFMIVSAGMAITGGRGAVHIGFVLYYFFANIYDLVFEISMAREMPQINAKLSMPLMNSIKMFGIACGLMLCGFVYDVGAPYVWLFMVGLIFSISMVSTYKGYCMIRTK
ncbi:hypothetical protein KHM83_01420 [Fusibacter paucivorans]|uniref:Major Facilitator Superfamily protein n=2 Tax=Fusibacter paucivorans TaxID=76009 RepID=A0ABS5PJL8_9FIRM|nr:hypothetical protein [Fusibacter paucivorans]